MEFNEIWTKEKNDELRKMICERRDVDEIRSRFGKDLDSHPEKKYSSKGSMLTYSMFQALNEIRVSPEKTTYVVLTSKTSPDKHNYLLPFKVNDKPYVVLLYYLIERGVPSYNVIFTTKEQHLEYTKKVEEIYTHRGDVPMSQDERDILSEILERVTGRNELLPLMRKVSYVLLDFYPFLNSQNPGIPLSVGETKNPTKIKLYRNIIRDSFENVKEVEGMDDLGGKMYYYYINTRTGK